MAAAAGLSQLPALQHLDLSHNPLGGCLTTCSGTFAHLHVLDLSTSRVKQLQPVQVLVECMPQLQVLRLLHTPLAERCRIGKCQEQVMVSLRLCSVGRPGRAWRAYCAVLAALSAAMLPGQYCPCTCQHPPQNACGCCAAHFLRIRMQALSRTGLALVLSTTSGSATKTDQRSRHDAATTGCDRVQIVSVAEAPSSAKVLAAASRAALAALPHKQLVAAFDRVTAGIDSWQQLAPVLEEEGSWADADGPGNVVDRENQAHNTVEQQDQQSPDAETIQDKTFLTGKWWCLHVWQQSAEPPLWKHMRHLACMGAPRRPVLGLKHHPVFGLQVWVSLGSCLMKV